MSEGFTYDGEWANGEIDGDGVATYANGDVYTGSFIKGRRQGEGTMRYASGEEVSGDWINGAPSRDQSPSDQARPEAAVSE